MRLLGVESAPIGVSFLEVGAELRDSNAGWLPLVVHLEDPPPSVATSGASHLYVTALSHGDPLGKLLIPSPLDHFPGSMIVRSIVDQFAEEIALSTFHHSRPSNESAVFAEVTVVICTKDRPQDLERCLQSIAALEGLPIRLIVVENGPETVEVQRLASIHGALYVSEPELGLDRARNRGLQCAETALVLFTDDDVEVDRHWARRLAACFSDPLVAAATGLVLPARLDTRARQLSELHASHGRGTRRRTVDGTLLSPSAAGSSGVGASMAFRRSFLRQIGGFPEELDAGMPTATGGDTYAFHKVLRSGLRIAYEPSAIAHHWHRETDRELVVAFHSNGKGISSYISHVIAEDHDLSAITQTAPAAFKYLMKRAAAALLKLERATPLHLTMNEIRGVLSGPLAYLRARAITKRRDGVRLEPSDQPDWLDLFKRGEAIPSEDDLPSLSVVIPTRGRRNSVISLLRDLTEQDYPVHMLEMIVVIDGDIDGTEGAISQTELALQPRLVVLGGPRSQGSGPGAARNAGAARASGEVILFLDDDVTPLHRQVLKAHALSHETGKHAAGKIVVAGPCSVDLHNASGFFAQRVRNWWVDHVERLNQPIEPAFTDLCTGNFSISKDLFDEIGGFENLARREDWELSYRLFKEGVSIVACTGAAVRQVPEIDIAESFADRKGEGIGDVQFARLHPEMLRWLPLGSWVEMGRRRRIVRRLIRHPALPAFMRYPAIGSLEVLQFLGMRRLWSRLVDLLNFAFYWSGVGTAVGSEEAWLDLIDESRSRTRSGLAQIDVDSEDPKDLEPGSAFDVLVTWRGAPFGIASPLFGGLPWDRQRFLAAAKTHFHDELVRKVTIGTTDDSHDRP